LQDEITSLEKELDDIDEDDYEDKPERLRSREIDVADAIREGSTRNRRIILREIREKLMEYGNCASPIASQKAYETDGRHRPSPHQSPQTRIFPKAF
jgi:hypothetical protein